MSNVSGIIKSIQDIMRKDVGVDGDAQRISQLVWMFFLKIYDDREAEIEYLEDGYESPLPEELRWRNWAADAEGMTGDELNDFVNLQLFPTLKTKLNLQGPTGQRALVIRNIFDLRCKGMGYRGIIKFLNEAGIPSPRFALNGKGDKTWSMGTMTTIVHQIKYKSDWTWNKTKCVKVPGSSKRLPQARPESEWVVSIREYLRIVSDEAWEKAQPKTSKSPNTEVKRGQQSLANPQLDNRGKLLLSGLLACSECGGNLVAITSKGISSYS